MRVILSISIIFCISVSLPAQDTIVKSQLISDTSARAAKSPKDPKKAALLSAILPGTGQIYNGKYWKLPLVYGGVGTAAYFIITNRNNYRTFKQYYLLDINPDTAQKSPYYFQGVQPNALKEQADQYRSWMEYSYLAFAAVYILQIVDASVDAHLSGFDVSDDLTLHLEPSILTAQGYGRVNGLSLRLTF